MNCRLSATLGLRTLAHSSSGRPQPGNLEGQPGNNMKKRGTRARSKETVRKVAGEWP